MKFLDHCLRDWRYSKAKPFIWESLLDIGCHDGSLLLRHDLTRKQGIDILIPEKFKTPDLIETTLAELKLDGEFKTITCLATYEHFSFDERESFWCHIRQHLAPNGLLVMTIPRPTVDKIIKIGRFLKLMDGMDDHQHTEVRDHEIMHFAHGAQLVSERQETFQLGLNRLFVFRKKCLD